MAQKDKIKELVGRSLNSYHTKSLQQIDRIEKKNKEQNHKISILSNELDNDYLTKTEEGSVVSLEHSKEGMVYLDEIQGNTLVNYCTDGFKELTLNGDIDVEGTFVTTTEGVDNGLVDVACEGNTLVNLNKRFNSTQTPSWDATNSDYVVSVEGHTVAGGVLWYYTYLKPSTTYTMVVNILECANMEDILLDSHYSYPPVNMITLKKEVGVQKIVFNTKDSFEQVGTSIKIATYGKDTTNKLKISKHMLLLEGDWTNKEIPQYFEGMKSVGECEDNKIEILSHNGNLYDYDIYTKPFGNYLSSHKIHSNGIKVKANNQDTRGCSFIRLYANEDLYISLDIVGSGGVTKKLADNTYIENYIKSNEKVRFKLEKGREYKIELNAGGTYDAEVLYDNIIISKNNYIDFIPRMFNKKEILLNEPLRGLPNGTKDRKVKIGGKWYIERNCREVILDGSMNWTKATSSVEEGYSRFYSDTIYNDKKNNSMLVCDKLPVSSKMYMYEDVFECVGGYSNNARLNIKLLGELLNEDVKSRLSSTPLRVIYELATPTYEEITDVELITYLDTTHISNNSTIPCNMKIKNSGYNAIIKPSTLYTVALDTNKSGTIGVNLGGAKVTTTNNVATITTPATLADDSLRLYGKDIKGSKVRLLEGDKTNWIPSYFEGMKSSFEDKFDATDNTYKMEILSNNENLLDLTQHSIGTPYTNHYIIKNNSIIGIYEGDNYTDFQIWFNLKRNRTYKLSYSQESTYKLSGNNSQLLIGKRSSYSDGCVLHQCYNGSAGIITNVPYDGWYTLHFHSLKNNNTIKDLQLKESNLPTDFVERKYNKIQFSSIEPLRGVDNTKDRFVFKDNKLMIERNCGYRRLDGTENWTKFNTKTKTVTQFYTDNSKQKHGTTVGTCTTVPWIGGRNANQEKEGLAGGGGAGVYLWLDVFNYKLESLDSNGIKNWLRKNNIDVVFELAEPIYEEIPFELQKIILEGYENGTLFFDTNIPPTSTVTYAGETPIVKSVKLNKTEVLNNTNDINDNIIPYLMDMDYRVVCLQLQSEEFNDGVAMARLFGGAYEMLKRDIQSKRYSIDEYKHRLDAYLDANKITEEEYNKLGDMLNE